MICHISERVRNMYADMHNIYYYIVPNSLSKTDVQLYVHVKVGNKRYLKKLADCPVEQAETMLEGLRNGLVDAAIDIQCKQQREAWKAMADQWAKDEIKRLKSEISSLEVQSSQIDTAIKINQPIYPVAYGCPCSPYIPDNRKEPIV